MTHRGAGYRVVREERQRLLAARNVVDKDDPEEFCIGGDTGQKSWANINPGSSTHEVSERFPEGNDNGSLTFRRNTEKKKWQGNRNRSRAADDCSSPSSLSAGQFGLDETAYYPATNSTASSDLPSCYGSQESFTNGDSSVNHRPYAYPVDEERPDRISPLTRPPWNEASLQRLVDRWRSDHEENITGNNLNTKKHSSLAANTKNCGHLTDSAVETQGVGYASIGVVPGTDSSECTQDVSHISLSSGCLRRLSRLLERPLVRIAREAWRLSLQRVCGYREVKTAVSVVIRSPSDFADNINDRIASAVETYSQSGVSAKNSTSLESMDSDGMGVKISKARKAGLQLPVSSVQRWMIDGGLGLFVDDLAAVCLTAAIEGLVLWLLTLLYDKSSRRREAVTTELLNQVILYSCETYGLFNKRMPLLAGRNIAGELFMTTHVQSDFTPAAQNACKFWDKFLSTTVIDRQELHGIVTSVQNPWRESVKGSRFVWTREALDSWIYYVQQGDEGKLCDQSWRDCGYARHASLPPLCEWVRVCTVFCSYRSSDHVERSDVMEAARLFLPSVGCPTRSSQESGPCTREIQHGLWPSTRELEHQLALRVLHSGHQLLLAQALSVLGPSGINQKNSAGFTPLILAAMDNDPAVVQGLLGHGAEVNMCVFSAEGTEESFQGWTALTCAAAAGSTQSVELLLNAGSHVEGYSQTDSPFSCNTRQDCNATVGGGQVLAFLTPLQLAAAGGYSEVVQLLVNRGADPYLISKCETVSNSSEDRKEKWLNAITLSAAQGQRSVMENLISLPISSFGQEEIPIEKVLQVFKQVTKSPAAKGDDTLLDDSHYEEIEPASERLRCDHSTTKMCSLQKYETLQAALYEACEHEYVTSALGLRKEGARWTTHTWLLCIRAARDRRKTLAIGWLLEDFEEVVSPSNVFMKSSVEPSFMEEAVGEMTEVFRDYEGTSPSRQVAEIFTSLYGSQPIPVLKEIRRANPTHIDPSYVNDPAFADVTLIVESKEFYTHKIILANASPRFRDMLSDFSHESHPKITISQVTASIFQDVMTFLYRGTEHISIGRAEDSTLDMERTRDLFRFSVFFLLPALQRHCEKVLVSRLCPENCIQTYRLAKTHEANDLIETCTAFFLRNFIFLLQSENCNFLKCVCSERRFGRQLLNDMTIALTERVRFKLRMGHCLMRSKCESSLRSQLGLCSPTAGAEWDIEVNPEVNPEVTEVDPSRKKSTSITASLGSTSSSSVHPIAVVERLPCSTATETDTVILSPQPVPRKKVSINQQVFVCEN